MSEEWRKQDRPCPPCRECGVELYERFWGNGGWAKTEKGDVEPHTAEDCVRVLKTRWDAAALSRQAMVLMKDVDDMMNTLRNVASLEYTRDEVREQAKAALERLKVRGVGDTDAG